MNNSQKYNKKQSIGDRIGVSRIILGLSQSQLSAKMFLSRTMCGQWERGNTNPSTAHLMKLSEVLGVSFEWLATGRSVVVDEPPRNDDDTAQANDQDEMMRHKQLMQMNIMFDSMSLKQRKYLLLFLTSMSPLNSDNRLVA